MSDTVQAPPPPSAPSPQGEVPINPNPVNPPPPVGSQAPPKPEHKVDSPAQSRRDSIAEAFRKSRDPEWQRNRPGPAQAAKGHNQPPEKTPGDKPRPAPLDLKKRPSEQPGAQDAQDQKPRGEHGRFAPRQAAAPDAAKGTSPPSQQGGLAPIHCRRTRPIVSRCAACRSAPRRTGTRRPRACAATCIACTTSSSRRRRSTTPTTPR